MRHLFVFSFCFVISGLCFAQDSRADLFGGYSYLNVDTNGLGPRQSANGWEASVSGNLNKWFAVEGDVSGYYKNYSVSISGVTENAKVTDYTFTAGPRINLRPVFIHALFGGDHLGVTASASGGGVTGSGSASQDGFGGLAGGGVQWKVKGPWSVRVSADYVFTHFGGSVSQNNVRASAGIVYSFGRKQASEPQAAASTAIGPRTNISALGVLVTPGRNPGAEIAEEAPNGVAALAGLHVEDVINSVDGKPVRTPMELAAELSTRVAGDKVRLGYLIRGYWQTETVILWPH